MNITASAAAISANLDLYETSLPASITITDNNPLTLTVGQISADATALSLTANANGSAYTVAIADTAAHVAADIDALNANSHITTIALSDPGTPALTLSVAQLSDATALGEITTPYTIAVSDTAAHVAAAIDALNANAHITTIALTDPGTVTLTLTIATALNDARVLGEITTPHTVALADTAANIASLTPTQIAALKTAGYVSIASTTGAVSMPLTEAQLLVSDGISVTGATLFATGTAATVLTLTVAQATNLSAAGYALQVVDTAAHIQALTAAQIASLAALHVTQISASDTSLGVTVAQAAALETAGMPLSAPAGLQVNISDTAAHIQALTVAQISALPAIGITRLASTNAAVKLTVAQTIALETGHLIVMPFGAAKASVSDTGANIATLTTAQIAALAATGIGALASTSGSVALSATQAIALEGVSLKTTAPSGSKVTVSDLAANLQALSAAQMAALSAAGVSGVTATDGSVTLSLTQAVALESPVIKVTAPAGSIVSASDTASNIETLTTTQIAGLKSIGLTALFASDANVALTVAQATALETAGVSLSPPAGGADAIVDTAAHIQALTAAQIASLAALHVTQISASDTSLGVTVAQAAALETAGMPLSAPAGLQVNISDTAAHIQALTVAQISALPAIGITGLASTNAAVKLTVAQTIALETGHLIVMPFGAAKASVSDTGANIATLTTAQIAALAATGIGALASTSGSVALSATQAIALEGVSLKTTAPSGSKVTVSDLAANLQALSAAQMAALSAAGVSGVTATDGSVTLSLTQAVALESPVIKVTAPAGSIVSASDTASNIETLTTTQIAGLKSIGLTALFASDANVALTVAQATALETAGVSLSPPAGGADAIVDTAAHIQALTAAQIASLAALHVTQISASDTSLGVTVAQAAALETAGMPLSAPAGLQVNISDTAAHIQALTVAQISALPAIGITRLASTNAAVKLTVAQTIALETGHLIVMPFGAAKASVSDTGANIATLTTAQIAALAATGIGALASTSGSVALSATQAIALEGVSLKTTAPSGSKVTVSDLAANLQALSAAQMAALSAAGVSGVTATDGSVTLSLTQAVALESPVIKVTAPAGSIVSASDTASNIETLTTTQIAGLKSIGLTALFASDANVALTVAQATALETAGVSLSPPAGGADAIVDTAAHIQALTAAQIASLAALHVTQISASDTSLGVTVAQAAALETAGMPLSAPAGLQVNISDTAAHIQALTVAQISALPAIGITGLASTNANVTYNASQTSAIVAAGLDLSAAGTHTVGETFSNGALITTASDGAGGGRLTLSTNANGVSVNQGASSLSVMAGGQTIPLHAYASEAITASGHTAETFALGHGFGNDTITGFAATGASHDLIQFEASMFSYLTPGMSQAAELSAVLANATTSGGNTTIADTSGDSLTLNSVSLTTLAANPADFKFV